VIVRSVLVFGAAALAEIAGAWLVWQGVRERSSLLLVGLGIAVLGIYGLLHTLQPATDFGRILAAYGGVFIGASLVWAMVVDGFRPDRFDLIGVAVCLLGVGIIMYAPRPGI
jgi:small multidrug resistance family-3 protein